MGNKHTESQRKFDKKNCRIFFLRLNKKTDADCIEKLESVPNKQGYIKKLIRDDMEEKQ